MDKEVLICKLAGDTKHVALMIAWRLVRLQSDLDVLLKWAEKQQVMFNPDK